MATDETSLTDGEKLAQRIKQVREALGLSQTEFARQLGVSRSYMSEIEHIKSKVSIDVVLGIAELYPYKVNMFWLLTGNGSIDGPRGYQGHIYIDFETIQVSVQMLNLIRSRLSRDLNDTGQASALHLLMNNYLAAYLAALKHGVPDPQAREDALARTKQVAEAVTEGDLTQRAKLGEIVPFQPGRRTG